MRLFLLLVSVWGCASASTLTPGEPSAFQANSPSVGMLSVEPDPLGRVYRDEGFITSSVDVAEPTVTPGDTARFTVRFRPVSAKRAHWNNVAPMRLWLRQPEGALLRGAQLREYPQPETEVSDEERVFVVTVEVPKHHAAQVLAVPGYALYYVCEDAMGTCMFRRSDFSLTVPVGR